MKTMKDISPNDRPREKIAKKGASALSDTELIEAIIGRGTEKRRPRTCKRNLRAYPET